MIYSTVNFDFVSSIVRNCKSINCKEDREAYIIFITRNLIDCRSFKTIDFIQKQGIKLKCVSDKESDRFLQTRYYKKIQEICKKESVENIEIIENILSNVKDDKIDDKIDDNWLFSWFY